MADVKKPDNLKMERIKLERLKVNRVVGTALITVLFICVLIACLSYMHPNRELGEKILEGKINTEQHQVFLEIEKNKLERFKVKGKIIIAIITVLFGSGLGVYFNYSLQSRQLKQQELVNESKIKQSEMENLGKFLEHALEDDINKRIRFADYFTKLTISEDVQTKWEGYHNGLVELKDEEEKLLAARKIAKTDQEKGEIDSELASVKTQTAPLRTKSEFEIAAEKAGLDKSGRPIKYTKSEYELQRDEQVVYDKTTELTWQQSGSDKYMNYERANTYIKKLNSDKVAGYSDWHLPTLKEAATLLEQEKKSNGMYIDPVFDEKQKWIWTSDMYSASVAWVVYFGDGYCHYGYFNLNTYVRAVR